MVLFHTLPSTGEVIKNRPMAKGYTATKFTDGSREEEMPLSRDPAQRQAGVTKAQEQAMLAGSMFPLGLCCRQAKEL